MYIHVDCKDNLLLESVFVGPEINVQAAAVNTKSF